MAVNNRSAMATRGSALKTASLRVYMHARTYVRRSGGGRPVSCVHVGVFTSIYKNHERTSKSWSEERNLAWHWPGEELGTGPQSTVVDLSRSLSSSPVPGGASHRGGRYRLRRMTGCTRWSGQRRALCPCCRQNLTSLATHTSPSGW